MRWQRLSLVVLTVVFGMSSVAFAQADTKEKKKGPDVLAPFFALPKEITLTDEQKGKVDELKKEYGDKIKEAVKTRDDILTKDQKKARGEAQKKAKDEGKKGKEAREAVDAAVALTDEQKASWKKAEEAVEALRKEVTPKLHALLTDEQKAKLPTPKKGKGKQA